MSLKNAAFFALIGMTLLTILLAVGFIRYVSAGFSEWCDCCDGVGEVGNSFAGKPECDRVPVRLPQSAVLNPQSVATFSGRVLGEAEADERDRPGKQSGYDGHQTLKTVVGDGEVFEQSRRAASSYYGAEVVRSAKSLMRS
jgi:hypothetical protein